ncbi:pyrroloquinoline quinone-dependent dehydrogenase [Solimonas sp. C16B3]|uniref:Pyrroloquinoline quinone-dependent dehydrogenase n=2 Tax=Solimonas marina TaxID=2714601 RepID=A0A970B492_9GAMM|nr:pyrroloquinoline quinone-dependent dehydrogenase [Solimonas marina]
MWGGASASAQTGPEAAAGWPAYGGDQGGTRFSPARQITPANVAKLVPAWTYSTGALKLHPDAVKRSAFENTPILADGKLFVCSPFNAVSALDPGTGKPIWHYDPQIRTQGMYYPNSFNCRGVAFWHAPRADAPCPERVILNTNDLRVIALDAQTGKPCESFGEHGVVHVVPEQAPARKAGMQITSAPAVANGMIIVGSSIDDNQRVAEVPGTVNAFDAETGALKWHFDVLSGSPGIKAGAANAWGPMSIDEKRGLVFVPTSSPSPDFWGGDRPGDDKYADSVVALRIADGSVAWSFQVTHHDVWDYDVAAQPTLATITYQGQQHDAVLQPTKQGLLFTLDRDTGKPIIPVVERPVPQDGAPGEKLSPTQPFPIAPRPLAASSITPDMAYGLTFWDRGKCRDMIAQAKHEGFYTPPSTQGTIIYPFTGGGTNWGGLAFNPDSDIAYVNTSNAMHLVTLIPAAKIKAAQEDQPHIEISAQAGAPYGMKREVMLSPLHMPCNPPPWGQLHAVDLHSGKVLWDVPLGTTADLAPMSQYVLGTIGSPNVGGPMVTAGGLVFIGAAMDDFLRAFDAHSGEELWKGRLPAGGQATPMSYMWKGRQYVVIAAGGHEKLGTKRGDAVVAYALPPTHEPDAR